MGVNSMGVAFLETDQFFLFSATEESGGSFSIRLSQEREGPRLPVDSIQGTTLSLN